VSKLTVKALDPTFRDYFDGVTPVKGVDYFDGAAGYTPVKGVDYFDGEKGADSTVPGPPGYTPIKGVDYFDGVKGDKGDIGNTGLQGLQGIQGIAGNDGATGVKGDTGDQGLQGIQGIKGDTGNQGLQGVKGDTGEQGIQGEDHQLSAYYTTIELLLSQGISHSMLKSALKTFLNKQQREVLEKLQAILIKPNTSVWQKFFSNTPKKENETDPKTMLSACVEAALKANARNLFEATKK
jgi:hypothetical protein